MSAVNDGVGQDPKAGSLEAMDDNLSIYSKTNQTNKTMNLLNYKPTR